jgi:hypothetical protein
MSLRFGTLLLHLSVLGLVADGGGFSKCSAQQPVASIPATSIRWDGPLGGRAGEPNNLYLLMASGAFREPTSPEFDSLVTAWSVAHPKAQAVIMSNIRGAVNDTAAMVRTVFVFDGESSLNLYLVRAGACSAGTMVPPPEAAWRLPPDIRETYESALSAAQDSARAERRGIWRAKA